CAFAMSRGMRFKIPSGRRTLDKLIGGVFSERPMLKAMSWSLTNCLSVRILSSRPPCCFCRVMASSSCAGRSRPSSIRMSAMRSPKDLFVNGMDGSSLRHQAVNILQRFDDRGRLRQIPYDGVVERLPDGFPGRPVKRIAHRHHDGAADQVE